MDEEERTRYARQIRLPDVGEAGQERLLGSRALIVGMGGLGSPVSMYLAAAGVGHLVISDFDRVEASNLQRQIVHRHVDIGESKASSAQRTLEAINPRVHVDAHDYEIDGEELLEQAASADVVVDCTDNFPSRFDLNRAALVTGTPLVFGAAIRWQGQVAAFFPSAADSPCLRCLYPDENVESATCALEGIIAPLVGVIGSMQALIAVRVLLGAGEALSARLLLFDGIAMDWQPLPLPRRPDCPACSTRP